MGDTIEHRQGSSGIHKPKLANTSQLCEVCQNIDFKVLWGSKRLNDEERASRCQVLGSSLELATRAQSCIFCQWLHENIFGISQNASSLDAHGKVYSLTVYGSTIYDGRESRRGTVRGYLIPIVELTSTDADGRNIHEIAHLRLVDVDGASTKPGGEDNFMNSASTTIRQYKLWLDNCLNDHEDCAHGEDISRRHELHLIDATRRKIVPAPPTAPYIALSYVWGASATRHRVVDGNLYDRLPQTIEDALALVLGLGYNYLWVDALCIPQDDEVVRLQQILAMDSIYESAVATIIATGPDVHTGLYSVSHNVNPVRSLKIHDHIIEFQPLPWSHLVASHGEASAEFSPWNTRGWTFQEGLISRRKLILTDHRIIFECNTNVRQTHPTDCHEQIKVELFNDLKVVRSESMRDWNMHWYQCLLNAYLKRNLTYDGDIIMAFSGISRLISAALGDRHSACWTIPQETFLSALMWAPRKHIANVERRGPFVDGQYIPSWHWSFLKLGDGIAFVQGSDPSKLYNRAKCGFAKGWLSYSWQGLSITGLVPLDGRLVCFQGNQRRDEVAPELRSVSESLSTALETQSHKRDHPHESLLTPRLDASLAWRTRRGIFLTTDAWAFASTHSELEEPNPIFPYARRLGHSSIVEENKQFVLLIREESVAERDSRAKATGLSSAGPNTDTLIYDPYKWIGKKAKDCPKAWRREGWTIVEKQEWEAETPKACEIWLA